MVVFYYNSNMYINILLLLAIVGSVGIGLLVLLNNRKLLANRIFFLLAISTASWTLFNLLTNISTSNDVATWFARLTVIPAMVIAYSIWLLSYYFPTKHHIYKVLNYLFFASIVVLTPLCFTGLNIIRSSPDGSIFETGPIYIVTTVYFLVLLVFALINYIRALRRAYGSEHQKLVYVVFGFFTSAILGVTFAAILPIFGFNSFLQAVPAVTIIMLTSFAYAMIRHRLFDLRAVVARSFAFVVSIGLLAAVYGIIAFQLVSRILPVNTSKVTIQVVYTALAIVLAFTFQPIRRFFERVSNAIFYRGKYDSQQLINEIGRIIAGEIQLDQLSHKVIRELAKQMKIGSVDIVVLSEKSVHFQTRVFSSEQHNVIVSDLKKLGRLAVVADEISGGEKKEIMKKYGYSVSLALRTSEEFLGYLLLGEKKSGDIYNTEDLQTLKTIANELSVGLQNAKAFAEIQAFNVTLQQRVNEATKNLRHANEQLKDLDKAKDEFISMASHQLRTPLTTVKGYVSMLDEGDFGKISKAQRQPLEQALDGSNRMARLIDDLLNVSRMEAGRFFIDATEIDLNAIVPQEIDQLQNLAKTKKVELTYKAPAKPIPKMHLDENKTRQVIMNLADNAVHYSQPPKGGGKVEVRLERDGDDIVYMVRDNGIGVPKDQQDKLFTKMFRARNAQEVRPDGTGLGLYLVKRVIEDQGGKVLFESEPGKGSVFGFRMPLHNKIVIDKKAQKALAAAHKNG